MVAAIATANAQTAQTTAPQSTVPQTAAVQTAAPQTPAAQQDNSKAKVEPAALPAPVKTTLAGEAYKGWEIAAAWTAKATPDVYEVELKKDGKTQTVKVNKEGTVK